MKNKGIKEITAPIVVLVSICLVASLLLSAVYQVTAPIIAEQEAAAAQAAIAAVLPQGSKFEPITEGLGDGVLEAYKAGNGAGYVIKCQGKGFGGQIVMMVGIDSTGNIAGVQVLSHGESAGIGTNALTEEYLGQYVGRASADVDAYSGATYSSKGVRAGVQAALDQFAAF